MVVSHVTLNNPQRQQEKSSCVVWCSILKSSFEIVLRQINFSTNQYHTVAGTYLRTCSCSCPCVHWGALICPYSSRCSLVVMWSKSTSYCMHTPRSLRMALMLASMSRPYTSMEPEVGPKRPVSRDLRDAVGER